jgi:hypothetical protein
MSERMISRGMGLIGDSIKVKMKVRHSSIGPDTYLFVLSGGYGRLESVLYSSRPNATKMGKLWAKRLGMTIIDIQQT